MRSPLTLATAAVVLAVGAASAQAASFALGPPRPPVSNASTFLPGCGGPGEASAGSVVYQNAEVETHVAVNPMNPANIVGFWQQDRWNDGGAHGNRAGYTTNGGMTWAYS